MDWLKRQLGLSGESGERRRLLVPEDVRVYAIGDIHGRADLLEQLFEQLKADISDKNFRRLYIVFLGDYIDRGFESKRVIDLLLNQKWGNLRAVFLKGNHEQTMLDFLTKPEIGAQWVEFGGRETLNSYGVKPSEVLQDASAWQVVSEQLKENLPETHLHFLSGLQTYFELGNCYFVHAGVDPTKRLDDQTDEDRLWIRDNFLSSERKLSKVIIHGHSPEENPVWDGRRIGVDTGAYITNRLSAARIQGGNVKFFTT